MSPSYQDPTLHNTGMLACQDTMYGNGLGFEDLRSADFFDSIMNMTQSEANGIHEALMVPPDVSNFVSEDLGFTDYDFGLFAGGLTRPSTAQGMRPEPSTSSTSHTSPHSEAQLRSQAFENSPWSWNHWIPNPDHSTFAGQEINITEQRVNADDHLTPGDRPYPFFALGMDARDRLLRLVTSIAASRLAIPSFPSLELLADLLNVFVLQERESIGSYIHWPSLDATELRTELLLAILAKGATYVALEPVWKLGLACQEVVRLSTGETFERDNSTTRQLAPLQAYMLYLDIGLWSGFRRKTEIATSFLHPAVTMLSWSSALTRVRYQDIEALFKDDALANESKWRKWIEQEALKRLVLHIFIHDSQASLAHARDPILSPARMQLPLPMSVELWQAKDAETWRSYHLFAERPAESSMPSVVALVADVQIIQKYRQSIDQKLCTLLACHLIAYDVLQFRQQATVLTSGPGDPRRDRWLAHMSRQKVIYDDLMALHSYCETQKHPLPEAIFLLHYLMMLLHASIDNIQLFSGRSGEGEARRVYPAIKAWTEDAESRTAVWHAGQVLCAARSFEKTKLRDFYAVTLNHATLTLWVYGMVTSNLARMSRMQSPARDASSSTVLRGTRSSQEDNVILDGEDGKQAKAFRHLGQGRPCVSGSVIQGTGVISATRACPLEHPKGVMLLAAQTLKDNFPNSSTGLPPLLDNLVKLMTELSKFSGGAD